MSREDVGAIEIARMIEEFGAQTTVASLRETAISTMAREIIYLRRELRVHERFKRMMDALSSDPRKDASAQKER